MSENANTTVIPAGPGTDPRRALGGALTLAGTVLAAVHPDQLGAATPCPDYTVRGLRDHLLAVVGRAALTGRGEDPTGAPLVADVTDDDWAAAWGAAVRDVGTAWASATVLERPLRVPVGTLPGAVAAVFYLIEITVHTWDVATATGQHPVWDPQALALSLAAREHALPAEPRGGHVPFAAVVEVNADAPAIDRLVAWYGRRP